MNTPPTLLEWMGGEARLRELTGLFYRRVRLRNASAG